MVLRVLVVVLALSAFTLPSLTARAQSTHENLFASILLKGDKIGQVHYTVQYGPDGDVEEIKSRASVTMLGVKLYSFTQDLHEVWRGTELQKLSGDANDDGTTYEALVTRSGAGVDGTLNGKTVALPADAFPDSIWHYAITEQSLLFSSIDLELKKVSVARSQESIKLHGKSVSAERFDFTGDWTASLWFDGDKQLLKAKLVTNNRDVEIVLDPQ